MTFTRKQQGAGAVLENEGAGNFVRSEMFARTFKEGMALVEDTANYLDGDGRRASKSLSKTAALSYAGASMRLTTQLMQIASWLLVLRAVREGDMSLAEAGEDKYRIPDDDRYVAETLDGELPQMLVSLIQSAGHLYSRIARLDTELFLSEPETVSANDAMAQQRALLEAFGSKG